MMTFAAKKRLLPGLYILPLLALASPSAQAQSGNLASDPFAQGDRTGALVKELNTLLEKGEKDRLIDPWFLRDLRSVIGKYDRPWSTVLLQDDFSARGPQPDPPWQVTAGDFLIDWRSGLRSVIEKDAAPQSGQSGSQGSSEKDIGKALLGALLQGALQGGNQNSGQSNTQTQSTSQASFAAVQAPMSISNAFAIEMTVSLRPLATGSADGFEFGPFQGANASGGYRLSYAAADNSLQLLRVSTRGTATIDTVRLGTSLVDEQTHRFDWTRDRDGGMRIALDGGEVMKVTDRSFRDPFDGFAILNRGGDFAIREVTVSGVPK